MNPLISIITPNYNSAKYIKDTLDSVINQTFKDWEWIITDDKSSDNSIEIIENYNDPRIKIIKLTENKGAANAYNTSLKNSNARFITFIDSDDIWSPEFLETSLNFLLSNKEELVYSNYARCDEDLKPLLSDFKADKDVTFNNLLYTCRLSTLSAMYDSKRVGKVYFPYDNKREDHSMWLTLLQKIKVGKALNKTMATYRIRKGSLSRNKIEMLKCQYQLYREFLKFSILKSYYYTLSWMINGILKYKN